jgi:hypothetical protein
MMVKDYTRAVLDRHGKEAALLLNQLRPMLEQGRTSDALTAIAWAIDMRSNSYTTPLIEEIETKIRPAIAQSQNSDSTRVRTPPD